jgi:hypothetical protein
LGVLEEFPPGTPIMLRDLLRESWLRPFGTVRPKLMGYWRQLTANPRKALDNLDRLFQLSPPIVQHLLSQADAVYCQQHDYSIPRDREEVFIPLQEFYREFYRTPNRSFRCQAMYFCIRHQISLNDFLELSWEIMEQMQIQNSGLAANLQGDVSLHCIILACLAFWS